MLVIATRTMPLSKIVMSASFGFGFFLLIWPAADAASMQCSAETLKGRYVFSVDGTKLHSGTLDFDGGGKFIGEETFARSVISSVRDAISHDTLSGTYALDRDCKGTMTLEGQPGGTAHWDLFVSSDGKKGRMIRIDPGVTGVRTFEQ